MRRKATGYGFRLQGKVGVRRNGNTLCATMIQPNLVSLIKKGNFVDNYI